MAGMPGRPRKRGFKELLLECALLATDDNAEIAEALEIPIEEVEAASDLLPVRKLGRLDRLEYVLRQNKEDRPYLLWSLNQGMTFVLWRLGKTAAIDPVEGLQKLFTDCVLKSKEAMLVGNGDPASVEGTKWVKLSTDLARLLKGWTIDSEAAMRDLEIALEAADLEGFKSLADLSESDELPQ